MKTVRLKIFLERCFDFLQSKFNIKFKYFEIKRKSDVVNRILSADSLIENATFFLQYITLQNLNDVIDLTDLSSTRRPYYYKR